MLPQRYTQQDEPNFSQKTPWKLKVIALRGMDLLWDAGRMNILGLCKTYHSTVRISKTLWNLQGKALDVEKTSKEEISKG